MRHLVRGLIAALLLAALPLVSQAGLFVSVTIAPPVLPVYYQPPIPGPGYIWTPGYWAWDGSYYWVPGTWVLAPVGLLWTPGYWGWADGVYVWNAGYWGPHVGFYGGVNYGFGYGGVGFVGGEWRGGQLYYNRSVTNISNTQITNVYNRTVVNNVTVNHTSFNGGPGGIAARPNGAELAAAHERHTEPLQAQNEHRTMAAHDNSLRASVNGGRPSIAATPRAGVFTGAGMAAARGAQIHGGAEGRANPQPRAGNNPPSEHFAQSRGGSPERGNYSQPHGGGPREYAQPRGGNPQGGGPQPNPGGYSQPHPGGYPQPHGQPGGRPEQARPEQGHAPQGRGNERQPQQGREEHPH
ncbi:MAG TPA: YXWGXW repeat-containing protein [Steroidobacteraceae bacterium]|nr:YXWGXW repeat-containing protein [Steroidobacteraceae bacterium]